MKTTTFVAGLIGVLAMTGVPSFADPISSSSTDINEVNRVVESWPETSRQAAKTVINKYGAPNEATPSRLLWTNNGVWKKTVVYREETEHLFPAKHMDVLEQTINYKVPLSRDRFQQLARFDGSLLIDRTKGELSHRSDSEEMNILALNLANDIITGKKSVSAARKFYARTAEMALAGKTSPYMEKLLFDVAASDTADPDQVMGKEAIGNTETPNEDGASQKSQEQQNLNNPITP